MILRNTDFVYLGALAQSKYHLPWDFKVHLLPTDYPKKMVLAIPPEPELAAWPPDPSPYIEMKQESVTLEFWPQFDVWVGYAPIHHVLMFKPNGWQPGC